VVVQMSAAKLEDLALRLTDRTGALHFVQGTTERFGLALQPGTLALALVVLLLLAALALLSIVCCCCCRAGSSRARESQQLLPTRFERSDCVCRASAASCISSDLPSDVPSPLAAKPAPAKIAPAAAAELSPELKAGGAAIQADEGGRGCGWGDLDSFEAVERYDPTTRRDPRLAKYFPEEDGPSDVMMPPTRSRGGPEPPRGGGASHKRGQAEPPAKNGRAKNGGQRGAGRR